MAEAAVSFLLQNLKDLGIHIHSLHSDANKELQGLNDDLELLQAKLKDAAAAINVSCEAEFRVRENRIRKVVYDAEDLIDDYATQELAIGKWLRWEFRKIDLAAKLKGFRNEIKSILEDKFLSKSSSATSTRSDDPITKKRQTAPLTDKIVVGFEDEIEKLIANVRNDDAPGVQVISITGMAGLGKTTVAWKIFRDPLIEHDFPTRIWIAVSQEYKERKIYLDILKNFTSQDFSNMAYQELVNKSKDYLSQVKFLLVVDDVWTNGAWEDIKRALPMTKGSGKVLMTSRHEAVANYAMTHELPPHRLRYLDEEESWELLQYEVYGNKTGWPSDSETIGFKISEKCGGLPLAIVVIGGILKEKIDPPESRKAEWEVVSESTQKYIWEDDKEETMKKIITLSYDTVPYSLRDCLLYFGVYPNNMEICVWNLTRLWIAEGFIKEKDRSKQSLEEVAVEILKELIRRNLVMVDKRNHRGEVKTCRVHDMIREFCKNKANDEKLFQLISKPSEQEPFSPSVDKVREFHRISIHSHAVDFLEKKPKGPHTRSFLCFSKHDINVPQSTLKSIVDAFERLRILEVTLIKFPIYHIKLAKLNHLRYISLAAGDNFKSLPEPIAFLWSLQTIVIDTSHLTFEIKADVGELRRLRHVKTKAGIVFSGRMKDKSNDYLQTLNSLSAESCKDGEVLSKTPNLQTLGVCGDLTSLVDSTCFKNLKCLTKMKMIKVSERPLDGFLADANFPPRLKILTLSGTNLEWGYMSTLGRLSRLEVLKLKDNAFKGDEWKVSLVEFRKLQYLHIDRSNLLMWIVEDGSLPELAALFLNNCERLRAVPPSLAKTLQTLEMGLVTRSAKQSAERMREEKGPEIGVS